MAIAHDDDWCEVTNGVGRTFIFNPSTVLLPQDQHDPPNTDLVVQLLRSKYSASYYEGMAWMSRFQQVLTDHRSCSSFHNSGCHIIRRQNNKCMFYDDYFFNISPTDK